MLRYWTAGESHGKTLLALVDGFPAGLTIDTGLIDRELAVGKVDMVEADGSGSKPIAWRS